jgi:hypothetical protein
MSDETVVLNPVTMNAELDAAVKAAINPEDLRAAILAEAQKQTGATQAEQAAAAQAETARIAAEQAAKDAATATDFSRTEIIGGREFTFTAPTELELERMVSNAYRVASAVQSHEPPTREDVVDPVAAQAAAAAKAEADAVARVELELKFKRGEIGAADYIEQSGAMAEYLEKQGVPLSALKAAVEQNQSSAYEKSWADATTEFLKSSDWPGGERNTELLGLKLTALRDAEGKPLSEAKDKVGALREAYASLQSDKMLFPPDAPASATPAPAAPAATTVATSAAPAPVAAPAAPAVAARTAPTSSSLFGVSSGTGATIATPANADATVEIPAGATPGEILEAWKAAKLKNGQDPNAAFQEAFRAKR